MNLIQRIRSWLLGFKIQLSRTASLQEVNNKVFPEIIFSWQFKKFPRTFPGFLDNWSRVSHVDYTAYMNNDNDNDNLAKHQNMA